MTPGIAVAYNGRTYPSVRSAVKAYIQEHGEAAGLDIRRDLGQPCTRACDRVNIALKDLARMGWIGRSGRGQYRWLGAPKFTIRHDTSERIWKHMRHATGFSRQSIHYIMPDVNPLYIKKLIMKLHKMGYIQKTGTDKWPGQQAPISVFQVQQEHKFTVELPAGIHARKQKS